MANEFVIKNGFISQGTSYVSNGNLGINTSTPTAKLSLSGSVYPYDNFLDIKNSLYPDIGTKIDALGNITIEGPSNAGYSQLLVKNTTGNQSDITIDSNNIGSSLNLKRTNQDRYSIVTNNTNSVDETLYVPFRTFLDSSHRILTRTGTTEIMYLDATVGNSKVGIGTVTPTAKLEVKSNSSTGNTVYPFSLNKQDGSKVLYLSNENYYVNPNNLGVYSEIYDELFNINLVGSSGQFKLNYGDSTFQLNPYPNAFGTRFLFKTNPGGGSGEAGIAHIFNGNPTGGNNQYIISEDLQVGTPIGGTGTTIVGKYIRKNNFNNPTTTFYPLIAMDGNVGIGTTTPQYKLDVKGSVLLDGTNTGSYFNYDTSEETFIRGGKTGSKVYINDNHNGDVDIATGGGNVGIGTTATSDKLTVNGSGYFFGELTVDNYSVNLLGTDTDSYFNYGTNQNVYIRAGKTDQDVYIQDNHNGLVGIGMTNPTAKLDVSNSTGYNQLRLRTSYTPTGSTDINGSIGDIAWDDTYFYWKTSTQWLRISGETF